MYSHGFKMRMQPWIFWVKTKNSLIEEILSPMISELADHTA